MTWYGFLIELSDIKGQSHGTKDGRYRDLLYKGYDTGAAAEKAKIGLLTSVIAWPKVEVLFQNYKNNVRYILLRLEREVKKPIQKLN